MGVFLRWILSRGRWFGITVMMLFLLLGSMEMTGCGKSEQATKSFPPAAIEAGDECHVCGMIITNFPGPKGESYVRGREAPLKFCSTRDLFSYLLQPESQPIVTQIYVHDMAATDWEHPADNAFVDAPSAWYVADQPLEGAMGPTLASFKHREDALEFIDKHGGKLLRFEDVTLELMAKLGKGSPTSVHP